MRHLIARAGLAASIVWLSGCATPPDYTAFRQHAPRSVLVLPPLNQSLDVKATYGVLSTVTRPLAEMGYYVFPVAVVDLLMKDNGLPTAGEMHAVPLNKLAEIIGADAVLYLTIEKYGTKYVVFDSATSVRLHARLVDVASGDLLWRGSVDAEANAGQQSGGNLIGSIVAAAINQVVASSTDQAHAVAAQANISLLAPANHGLLYGPYHPKYGLDGQ